MRLSVTCSLSTPAINESNLLLRSNSNMISLSSWLSELPRLETPKRHLRVQLQDALAKSRNAKDVYLKADVKGKLVSSLLPQSEGKRKEADLPTPRCRVISMCIQR
eukprot:Skav236246  [mRNA]  locus=scaffold829:349780:351823:- [translate_table: standard]